MHLRTYLYVGSAVAAIAMTTGASAQSTGTADFEGEIVVTGTRVSDVGGVQQPDTSKARTVLTQDLIERQNPGQTVLDTINMVPGVSFQNNDAYGSSGGTLTIRGFDSTRIAMTWDGLLLNDSGSYAVYSNQTVDPELVDSVNVSLGSTDVDSPTASAAGGTVGIRTIMPREDFSVRLSGSMGEFDMMRIFGIVHTGEFTPWGTRAFFSASTTNNRNPFNNYGRVDKKQFNARIYQPLGGDDFISIAGHWNENRNNFFGSLPLRWDANRVVGSGTGNRFPMNSDEREYDINYPCQLTVGVTGVADTANTCGTEFDRRFNPSNTGNIRVQSRFTLSDRMVLTIDPNFQYVKANGGGTATAREFGYDINGAGGRANCATATNGAAVTCVPGYFGGSPYAGGVDLNGDGDTLDQVTVLAPSQTQTHRIGVTASLRYDINDDHIVRLAYTYDRARHRQTGQVGLLQANGTPYDVFPVNDPVFDVNGVALQKRDRLSYAILHQISGEYRGDFGPLTVNAGIRVPFFRRNLNNYCFASSPAFVECSGGSATVDGQIATLNPTYGAPQQRVLNYSRVLPNVGIVYDFTPQMSVFASFAQGISVPGTDNLYQAFFYPVGDDRADPNPEKTDSFELGLRYRSSMIQASIAGWYTHYTDRSASAYDPELDRNVYRNLGTVNKWGIDASISARPTEYLTLTAFGSWNDSDIRDDVAIGLCNAAMVGAGAFGCGSLTDTAYAPTSGKRESGSPTYQFGGSARVSLGAFDLGITAKRTGPRYVFDTNLPTYTGSLATASQVFPSKAPAYWLANLDARLNLSVVGLNEQSYFQLNVYNLFNNFYVGGFGGGLSQSLTSNNTAFGNPSFVQIGAPRTISGTVSFAF